ncbi:hypothetical protein [Lentibacillus juripiscarius]
MAPSLELRRLSLELRRLSLELRALSLVRPDPLNGPEIVTTSVKKL